MGVVYNLFAAIRRVFTFKKVATFIADQFFWIIGLFVFFCTLHITCSGEITWYGCAGMTLGLVLYLASLSRFMYFLLLKLVELLKKLILAVFKIFLMPLIKIIKAIKPIFRPIKKLAQNSRKKTSNFVKNNVAKVRRLSILLRKI